MLGRWKVEGSRRRCKDRFEETEISGDFVDSDVPCVTDKVLMPLFSAHSAVDKLI